MSNRVQKWEGLKKLVDSCGPFQRKDFEPDKDLMEMIGENVSILVIGAGGLGCELLKNLALMGFKNIEVIDADTIDLSNLNRQFLFRTQDIGRSKAEVAAQFINNRVSGCKVVPHHAWIQDFGCSFYKKFHVVVCGLDSVLARRWINGMLASLVEYHDDGEPNLYTVIPLVDGGTEGFKGNARVVLFGKTPCIECTLDLYPPQISYPLCTLAHTPRLPEHCVEYVRVVQWSRDNPFGSGVPLDPDRPEHLDWCLQQARARAIQHHIEPVPTYRLTQGVLKHIVPAVASTNAVVAAVCATEVFKLVTFLYDHLDNYVSFNDLDGIYTQPFQLQRKDDCLVCSNVPKPVIMSRSTSTVGDLVRFLKESPDYQLINPALTTVVHGVSKTLYIKLDSMKQAMQKNLNTLLIDLGLEEGQIVNVTDSTSPGSLRIRLKFE